MTLVKHNPANLGIFFDELLNNFPASWGKDANHGFAAAPVNIHETNAAYLIELSAPGRSKEDFFNPHLLAQQIKNFKLNIDALAPIDEAISTVGGICLTEINLNFELNKLKNNFVIGEMLNYDAPTGGYLLQSCFSMGKFVADYLNKK